ncbi:MAG: hypothetical protein ACTTIU_09635 [Treponema lecithinolyticum]|uniref:hypothetical protein n=1 Tax=Treponema lecithinolyticum TaxID=53418 RepID=UPI003FA25CDA
MITSININPDNLMLQEIRMETLRSIMLEIFYEGKIDWEKLHSTLDADIDFSKSKEGYLLRTGRLVDLFKSGKDLNSNIKKIDNYYRFDNVELVFLLESVSQKIVDAEIAAQPNKVIALDKLFDDSDQLKTNTALQMYDASVEFRTA